MVGKSGIYKIQSICKPERIYVGSAVYFASRWSIHRVMLRKGNHHSRQMQRYFDKKRRGHGNSDLFG